MNTNLHGEGETYEAGKPLLSSDVCKETETEANQLLLWFWYNDPVSAE